MVLRGYFYSNMLQVDTRITFIAPEKIKPPLKVIYLLHGLISNSDSWIDNTMLTVYSKAMNCLIVMPEVNRSFYCDMKYGQKYFSYVSKELPDYCSKLFTVSNKREDIAIMGGSMGGFGALKVAFSNPNKYGHCYAFAPSCLDAKKFLSEITDKSKENYIISKWGEQFLIDFKSILGDKLEYDEDFDVFELAKKAQHSKDKPRVHISCGKQDWLIKENREFAQKMNDVNVNFEFVETDGKHDWYYFDKALKNALEACFNC